MRAEAADYERDDFKTHLKPISGEPQRNRDSVSPVHAK